jgi:hypothetical protein
MMSDALSDLTQEVTPEYVRRRVDDWERRVEGLYDLLEWWLPQAYTTSRARTVLMNEELMQQHGISSRPLRILDISTENTVCASIIPRGLWIIGANGRFDIRSERGIFIIIDRSQAFETPSWYIAALEDRRFEPLTQNIFQAIL